TAHNVRSRLLPIGGGLSLSVVAVDVALDRGDEGIEAFVGAVHAFVHTVHAPPLFLDDAFEPQNQVREPTHLSSEPTHLAGDVADLAGDVTALTGDLTDLAGGVTTLAGEFTDLAGDLTDLRGVILDDLFQRLYRAPELRLLLQDKLDGSFHFFAGHSAPSRSMIPHQDCANSRCPYCFARARCISENPHVTNGVAPNGQLAALHRHSAVVMTEKVSAGLAHRWQEPRCRSGSGSRTARRP